MPTPFDTFGGMYLLENYPNFGFLHHKSAHLWRTNITNSTYSRFTVTFGTKPTAKNSQRPPSGSRTPFFNVANVVFTNATFSVSSFSLSSTFNMAWPTWRRAYLCHTPSPFSSLWRSSWVWFWRILQRRYDECVAASLVRGSRRPWVFCECFCFMYGRCLVECTQLWSGTRGRKRIEWYRSVLWSLCWACRLAWYKSIKE